MERVWSYRRWFGNDIPPQLQPQMKLGNRTPGIHLITWHIRVLQSSATCPTEEWECVDLGKTRGGRRRSGKLEMEQQRLALTAK